jgi:hypothetical protein
MFRALESPGKYVVKILPSSRPTRRSRQLGKIGKKILPGRLLLPAGPTGGCFGVSAALQMHFAGLLIQGIEQPWQAEALVIESDVLMTAARLARDSRFWLNGCQRHFTAFAFR